MRPLITYPQWWLWHRSSGRPRYIGVKSEAWSNDSSPTTYPSASTYRPSNPGMLSTRASPCLDSLAIVPIVSSFGSLPKPGPLLGQGQQCVEPAPHVLGAHTEHDPADAPGEHVPWCPGYSGALLL